MIIENVFGAYSYNIYGLFILVFILPILLLALSSKRKKKLNFRLDEREKQQNTRDEEEITEVSELTIGGMSYLSEEGIAGVNEEEITEVSELTIGGMSYLSEEGMTGVNEEEITGVNEDNKANYQNWSS